MDTVVFDKTGTITEGVFEVVAVETVAGYTEDQVGALTAAAEQYSAHPIAKSIRAKFNTELTSPRSSMDSTNIQWGLNPSFNAIA